MSIGNRQKAGFERTFQHRLSRRLGGDRANIRSSGLFYWADGSPPVLTAPWARARNLALFVCRNRADFHDQRRDVRHRSHPKQSTPAGVGLDDDVSPLDGVRRVLRRRRRGLQIRVVQILVINLAGRLILIATMFEVADFAGCRRLRQRDKDPEREDELLKRDHRQWPAYTCRKSLLVPADRQAACAQPPCSFFCRCTSISASSASS